MASTKDMAFFLALLPGRCVGFGGGVQASGWGLVRQYDAAAPLPLPWRGRVGSHEAKRNARRGGVTASQLGRRSGREAVTPPRSHRTMLRIAERTLPLQGRVRKLATPTRS